VIRKLIVKLEFDEVEMLGKIVKVIADRPLGTYHPKHKDIYYSVNYGYVEGIIAADGEEQDAYILGVNEPIREFNGKVIAVIHRFNDVEEKWVVAPEGASFTKDEIIKQVDFQEKFFKIEIRM
jgi:inorganic pyrophosphatase